jgi:ABC-type nitrate/sulfonate/bicarbonate transport system substrate-binding protein
MVLSNEIFGTGFGLVLCLNLDHQAISGERVRFGTSGGTTYPIYYLPVLAAKEGGFWEENGLDVKWISFQKAGPLNQAIAEGKIDIGIWSVPSSLQAISRTGISIVFVAGLYATVDFIVWVHPDSRVKKPKDLKGVKIGVSGFGGAEHGYGCVVVRALGLERDVEFVVTGGITKAAAEIQAGTIDAVVMPPEIMIMHKMAGKVRELVPVANYFPKEWVGQVLFATKDCLRNKPDVVRRVVKSILQATEFIRKNPRWAIEKMKLMSKYSEEAAQFIYDREEKFFTKNGKINSSGIENMKDFLIKSGIIQKEKVPALTDIYISEFTD